ncbi:MAG: DUF1737 domain-containing protein [Flavobacterium sp.]|nr:MAG: DUF1737 domain-containing protein [Flavobacterium sp.]
MHIVAYIHVAANSSKELVELANQKLNEGWQPLGGVATIAFVPTTFLQAMV